MLNLFNSVKMTRPKNNVFDLSHDVKLSLNMGKLVPTLAMECVPGDKFNIGCESLLRFAPLVAPVMHRMDVTMHYFFVPNRLLWPKWEDYITQVGVVPAFPTIEVLDDSSNYTKLLDYLGCPLPGGITGEPEVYSALPMAAYQMIYNEYYRDQNLISEVNFLLSDGDNSGNGDLTELRTRAWEHDYFTSALPFAQKGNPVAIPIGTITVDDNFTGAPLFIDNTGAPLPDGDIQAAASAIQSSADPGNLGAYDPDGSLVVAPTLINDLRRAFRLQEWFEKAARGGSRYIESILAHFGVYSSDKRLNRPEYITGTKSPVVISEVLNTTGTVTAPQGEMAGHGVSVTQGKYGNYRCEEHGYIIGIMSVMPKTAYQQGVPKHFTKFNDPFEFYWPEFANIGEQEIFVKELWAHSLAANDIFGYTPRYAEYKFQSNRVAGDFRTTLDFWHEGRIFAGQPALNQAFVEADPSFRIFAVDDPNVDHLYCQILHKIRAVRPMPKYGNPSF